jgi:hypothetical protein
MENSTNQLEVEAAEFRALTVGLGWRPNEWNDVGEICFEWVSATHHAIVSIEGDGMIGYAMLRGDRFVAGSEDCPPSRFPQDLAQYLAEVE